MTGAFTTPLPAARIDVEPTADQIAFFHDNGFLAVERLTTDEELEWLTQLFEYIFAPENADRPGAPVDRTNGATTNRPVQLSQAFLPEMFQPDVLRTNFNRNARRYAATLLGVEMERISCWGHMIRKLPGGRQVPWHQDEAYWEPELAYLALGCWLPLHAVSVEMGAMQFIPGSHKGELHHHTFLENDPTMYILVADDVDESAAVACPLPAGAATFHHSRTLHYTAPNTTSEPRLAFPTEFQIAPVRRPQPSPQPWIDAHRAATGRVAPDHFVADGRFVKV
jgi:hypothetical protein